MEVKLQTSPTIDLGTVYPTSSEYLNVPKLRESQIRICDVRYAVFYAVSDGQTVVLTDLIVTTGDKFFHRFQSMQGSVINRKIQIRLPAEYFDE